MGRVRTLTWYLYKNYVLNPFIKKHKILAIIVISIIIVALVVAAISAILSPPLASKKTAETYELGRMVRSFLSTYGLNRYVLSDLISIVFMVILAGLFIAGRSVLTVVEEAEYEVLLAQPISMKNYILARLGFQILRETTVYGFYLFFIPLALEVTYGSLIKAILLIISIYIAFTTISILVHTATLVNIIFESSGRRHILRILSIVYLSIGGLHSILILHPSPVLSYPFKPIAISLVYSLSISSSIPEILLAMICSSIIVVILAYISIPLANHLSPECIKPVSMLARERMISSLSKHHIAINYSSVSKAIRSYILNFSILSTKHVKNISIAIIATASSAYIVKHILKVNLNSFPVLGNIPFLTGFLIPFYISIVFSSVVSATLSSDLMSYWIYRVYSIDMKPVAQALMIKYSVYFIEIYLIIAIIDSIFTSQSIRLILPIALLPITILSSFLVLTAVSYFASKRRIIRQAPSGLYMLEELVMSVILVIIAGLITISKLGFDLALELLNISNLIVLIPSIISSIVLSPVLFYVLTLILGDLMKEFDIAS